MSLKHALLGFLNNNPSTGYELKRYFETSVRHFWPASLSQIYPTLSQMEKEGLVTMKLQYQENHPNRKVYYISKKGQEELQHWLQEPMDMYPVRQPFLIKLWFGTNLKNEELLVMFRNSLRQHKERLALLANPGKEVMEKGDERTALFWRMVVDSGIVYEEAIIGWMEDCIKKIEKMSDKEAAE